MNEKKLRAVIAQAMYTGGILAEKNYGGVINDETHKDVVSSLLKLEEMLQDFFYESGATDVNISDILPLHNELEVVSNLSKKND